MTRRRGGWPETLVLLGAGLVSTASHAALPRMIDASDYADRLRAMWLAQVIANWTGRQTEGQHPGPPFLTDADWGGGLGFVTGQDPWLSDDDTDIEYVYLELLGLHQTTTLSPEQIARGWIDHINQFIWVSNARARELIGLGLLPPTTSLIPPNLSARMIDAQLTTELFGARAPGMPIMALEMADLPIRTTAADFAAHAAQFHVVLYSLAPMVDSALPPREQAIWLVAQARRYIPDSSKSADIVDFVLADYLANPEVNDWERTRDAVYDRYQLNAQANGFQYGNWFESSVNFATGLIALLYGELDLRRTMQIGTLSGWDSDNGTATMGGLIGLLRGSAYVEQQFPGIVLSDRFNIHRTRPTMPDRLPLDPGAQDTFTLMAQRMIPLTEMAIVERGGLIDSSAGRWLLPGVPVGPRLDAVPTRRLEQSSANNRVRREGGLVASTTSHPGSVPCCGNGAPQAFRFALGQASNFRGVDGPRSTFFSSFGSGQSTGDLLTLTLTYDRDVEIARIRMIEGPHWHAAPTDGGWFSSISFEALIGGSWIPLSGQMTGMLDPNLDWQQIDLVLGQPIMARGVRLIGAVVGADAFVTLADFDALAMDPGPGADPLDADGSGIITIDDLYAWESGPTDLDGDGLANGRDHEYLVMRLRWREPSRLAPQ